ncbi:MAG: hypothetical protein M1826_006415 [Phylliscum demangeonii]|nr:MAG: hypothetical protein M1826_006415 [Phylliscum demangeonii]
MATKCYKGKSHSLHIFLLSDILHAACVISSRFATINFLLRVLAQRIKQAGLKAGDLFIVLALVHFYLALSALTQHGGGIRGVSELVILDEIMKRIQRDRKLSDLPRPCDYFHLIGGTSTGGYVLLDSVMRYFMVKGRLRMDTTQALNAYNTIAGSVFSEENKKWTTQDGLFHATTLQNRVEDLVALRKCGDYMLDETDHSSLGKAFVVAMPAHNMTHPRLFRTYRAREPSSVNCKIWEAARATTAAVTFFERIAIGQEEFIDAGIKCYNPAIRLLSEAQTVFGGDRPLNCLVSIGTGHPGVIGLSTPSIVQNILPTDVVEVLKRIATDCESTAHELSERFGNAASSYFRFNVTHGAGSISLEEWRRMGEVEIHTRAYLNETVVNASINAVVSLLCKPGDNRVTLADAC